VAPVLARLGSRREEVASEPVAVAQAMTMLLAGQPASQIAALLEQTLAREGPEAGNWDTRAALLWVLVVAERFRTVEESLEPMLAQVHRGGSARGFVAAYSTLGLLRLRLGALPEADAAARVALRVLQEGDFAPGLGFAATVLSDIAVEAGEPGEAQALLDLLPQQGWPAGVGTVLIPAARGRLRLAQGRAADALADFQACQALFSAGAWGMPIRDTGYVHARSGAALALLQLGRNQDACHLADAELADVRVFGVPRALGIALRTARLARGGQEGLALLRESGAGAGRPLRRPAAGRPSPRRAQGRRGPPAAPVAHRGGRADPQRTARRPAGRRRPLQPRDRRRAVRHPQGHRRPPRPRLRQARDPGPRPAAASPRQQKRLGCRPYGKPPVTCATVWLSHHLLKEISMAITVREAFEKGTDTFNAHDIDGFTSVLADDVTYSAPGGMSGQGKAACAQFFAAWWDAFPNAHVDVHAVHIADDVVTEEGTFTGTHHGTLRSPAGDIAPTGRPVTVDYIHVLRYRDGMHVSFNLLFDRLLMLEQLGLIPAPAPAG
jgi:ketosteroid isomerase-like protein